MSETIFALASAPGRAGVAVFRLSGPRAGAALAALTGELPPPRRAARVRVRDDGGETIDDGLALWFPAPASFTGEDVAELHLHGGRAVAAALAGALVAGGLRPAEPGEFSRRAFLAGKLDLTQAEGLADLVAAETEAQRRQARAQMEGALAATVEEWRAGVLRADALLEARIDFADEEDVPAEATEEARRLLAGVARAMRRHLDDGGRGERLREGFQVALVGAPNVGKSSLLNRIAGREAAIVAATPGTTRDVIEVRLDLGGLPVTLWDTAGLRDAEGEVEAEGVRRARARAAEADLRLVVFDGTQLPALDAESVALLDGGAVAVVNKCDAATAAAPETVGDAAVLAVSALRGDNIDGLLEAVAKRARMAMEAGVGGGAVLTRARHRAAVGAAAAALERAGKARLPELAAEEVRSAAVALGRITGRIGVEDVLDTIFGEFCIGK